MNLHIRNFTEGDLAFADSLRALAGWNQTIADWRRFLGTDADGCFVAELDGLPVGTATTTTYGPALAWIGMVLVHPDHRRRGIGRALLIRCLEHLRQRGVRCIKLDATPAGQPVYQSLGFESEWTLTRWQRSGNSSHPSRPSPPEVRIRKWRKEDLRDVEQIDSTAFGVSRAKSLSLLMSQASHALVAEEPRNGSILGYGLMRTGARALYLGPVVAMSPPVGSGLLDALLATASGREIYWDLPDLVPAWREHALGLGLTVQRTLTRMFLGSNETPGKPEWQAAIAGPEIG
jgi:GNAT superfamily N-acetyltransferase